MVAPDADVIVFGHAGFERYGSIREILSNVGTPTTVTIKAWRYTRDTIPTDAKAMIDWLFDRWLELDRWIASVHDHALEPANDTCANQRGLTPNPQKGSDPERATGV